LADGKENLAEYHNVVMSFRKTEVGVIKKILLFLAADLREMGAKCLTTQRVKSRKNDNEFVCKSV